MPDAIVIGAGVVGAAAALELAERGAEVVVLERGPLGRGASGASNGLLVAPDLAALAPLAEASVALYERVDAAVEGGVALDREARGTLLVATDEEQLALLDGLPGSRLGPDELRAEEPALRAGLPGALLQAEGRRLDPAALVAALGALARHAGARILLHTEVKRLIAPNGGGVGVLCDAGVLRAPRVVLAAGAWTRRLAQSSGVDVPVRRSRGWLAELAPGPALLRHVLHEAGWRLPAGPLAGRPATLADLAGGAFLERAPAAAASALVHEAPDGRVLVGSSRAASLVEGPEGGEALRETAARAVELVPALGEREVAGVWTGLRPASPDGLPYVDRITDGVLVCAGHGSQGIISGGGSGRLVAELALDAAPFTDPSPFRLARPAPEPPHA